MRQTESFEICDQVIGLGERRNLLLEVSQSYTGGPVSIPVIVYRGEAPGPAVFVTGALHGNELNGTGIVRALILESPFALEAGTLVLVPVVNILGFERHSRYLPDRRDLNRCFPGSPNGSLASRFADHVFREIISKCDYGIDIHTAAVRRINFPNVRGDLRQEEVGMLARAFGCEIVVNNRGPKGSLRRAAVAAGCATIILEAGEVLKIEPTVVELGVEGVRNVLVELGMVAGERSVPVYQARVNQTKWIRADVGGMLQFHVTPGDVVEKDQAIATNTNLLGEEQNLLASPSRGIVLGMTTLPFVKPGDPVCQIGVLRRGLRGIRSAIAGAPETDSMRRIREDLATRLTVEPTAPKGVGG